MLNCKLVCVVQGRDPHAFSYTRFKLWVVSMKQTRQRTLLSSPK